MGAKNSGECSLELVLCQELPPEEEGLATARLGELRVKVNVAGREVKSEPRNQSSVLFKSVIMVKMIELEKYIRLRRKIN